MNDRLLQLVLLLTAAALPLLGLRDRAVTPQGRLVFRVCLAIYVAAAVVGFVLLAREGGAG